MTVPGSFPKMWRSWGDGKKIVAILDLSRFSNLEYIPVIWNWNFRVARGGGRTGFRTC